LLNLRLLARPLLVSAFLVGCSSEALDDETEKSPEPKLLALEPVYTPKARVSLSATALAFNASVPGELWVVLRQPPSGLRCTMDDDRGCSALRGMMGVVSDATGDAPHGVIKEDGNSWHFMRRPTAIAWGEGELFGTCGEALTDNYEDVEVPYAGPVLWSSNPSIFGVEPEAGQNGTHLDMLHESPRCMGIAHESGNAFWIWNGEAGALDRVDFHAPHPIGGEDHDDGEVFRYAAGELLRVPEIPSHVVYDAGKGLVYAADTGHGRILSVDPRTAELAGEIDTWEVLRNGSGNMAGATLSNLVPPGRLQKPSGLWLDGERLYVTDNATSEVWVFDTDGTAQKRYTTGLPVGALAGITRGPDGRLYLSDLQSGNVFRATE
jgi:hypothetical protein